MSEQTLRRNVVKALRPLHAMAVENRCLPGTPDVNYAGGWIELKYAPKWPKNPDRPLRLPHPVTPEQKIWLLDRENLYRESVNILIQVGNEYLLISPSQFFGPRNDMTREGITRAAWGGVDGLANLRGCLASMLS